MGIAYIMSDSTFYNDIDDIDMSDGEEYYTSEQYLEEKEWKNLLDLFTMLFLEFIQLSVNFVKKFSKFIQQAISVLETNAFLKSLQFKIFNPSNFILFTAFLKKLISELQNFFEFKANVDYEL